MKGLFSQDVKAFKKKRFTEDRAHAAPPGSGPAFLTCKTCDSLIQVVIRSGKRFWKCKLMKKYWSHGAATDIKRRDWACSFYKS